MTASEYAEHRGVSGSYIRRMRRQGNLVLTDAGLIDVQASDEMLGGMTHPVRGGPRPGSGRPTGGGRDVQDGEWRDRGDPPGAVPADGAPSALPSTSPKPSAAAASELAGAGGSASPPASITVHEAVRRERLARARLAELELGEQAGQLMRVDVANRLVFTLVRQALNQLQGMSGRMAKTLAAEADPFRVGALLDAEVAQICEEMRAATASLLEGGGAGRSTADGDADDGADHDPDPDSDEADSEVATR